MSEQLLLQEKYTDYFVMRCFVSGSHQIDCKILGCIVKGR
jgi:hypothetical protein